MVEKLNFHTQQLRKSIMFSVLIVMLLSMIPFFYAVQTTFAQSTTIKMNPAVITINGCETVDLYVRIENVTHLYGADLAITFDPSLIEVVSIEDALDGLTDPILTMPVGQYFYIYKDFDNNAGLIRYAMTHLNPAPEGNGAGNLILIRLRAKAPHISPFSFSSAALAAPGGVPIAATAFGGAANAIAPTAPNNFTITQLSSTTARLAWDQVGAIEEYLLYREDNDPYFAPSFPWQTLPDTTTQYDDTTALGLPSTNHYYQLASVCQNGFTSDSAGRLGEFDFAITPGTP